jgi:protein-S-isoprenylcysteine O-methyltransferase Ste14
MDVAAEGSHVTKFLRHTLAVAALPFVVAVIIPVWLARSNDVVLRFAPTRSLGLAQALGLLLLITGALLFVGSLRRFATDGDGTLAPWDPPQRLVVTGLYRYVRNPMITGVLFVVTGEALMLWSGPHAEWAFIFFLANALYIPVIEEPLLLRRFGAPYREYCRHVRRFLPRLRPWAPSADGTDAAASPPIGTGPA